ERCEIKKAKKDGAKVRVQSKDAPKLEEGCYSVVPELSGILEVSIEETETHQTEAVEGGKKPMAQAVFKDSADMKQAVRAELMKDGKGYDVRNFYKQTGLAQRIARNPLFENITMLVIGLYAIWMAIDTDLNDADVITDAPPFFFAMEQVFCAYFFVELVIRFIAFAEKRNCLKDAWFLFDLALVIMMVLENWVMTLVLLLTGLGDTDGVLGNANILRLARLMRLTRLLRMARLLRMVPELLILVKAIAAAMRSVGFTLILLILMLYVFGIGFTQILKGTLLQDSFPGVLLSMQMLFLRITLLDNISDLFVDFMDSEQWVAFVLLYSFLIMSAITVANMLIGVICEVITAVAAAEKEAIQITFVKDTLLRVMGRSDANFDGRLQKNEFFKIARDKQAVKALKELGVDMLTLIDFADIIFENASESEESEELSFSEFMEVILQFRGSNTATVKDMVDFRKWFTVQYRQMLREDMEAILSGKGSPPLNRRQQLGGLRQTIFSSKAHRWTPNAGASEPDHISVNL
ncbi:Scn11a, partial [Symbiodinium pilosum]